MKKFTTKPSLEGFDYDAIPTGYYDRIFSQRRGAQSKWHHLKFHAVRKVLSRDAVHLDVACGPGTFLGTFPDSMRCLGVDIAEAQIDYARTHHGGPNRTFSTMKPGLLPCGDDSFDSVSCIELIEHIDRDETLKLMRECLRVLKRGGKAIFTTPNYGGVWPLIERALNRFGEVSYEDQHITRYTKQRLRAIFASAGFTDIKISTCLFSAPFSAALSWKFADHLNRIEDPIIRSWAGHLLIGVAIKS